MTITNEYVHNAINDQFTQYKRNKTSRADRMAFVTAVTEQYFAEHGRMPPHTLLDRMATLLLQDELTDDTPWKSQNNEYHIQSEREELDYYKGLTARGVPETIAANGVDMRTPTRRKRSPSENARIDREMGRKRRAKFK